MCIMLCGYPVRTFFYVYTEENLLSMGFLHRAEFYFSKAKHGGLAFLCKFIFFALNVWVTFSSSVMNWSPQHSHRVCCYIYDEGMVVMQAWLLWQRKILYAYIFFCLYCMCDVYDFINLTAMFHKLKVLFHKNSISENA